MSHTNTVLCVCPGMGKVEMHWPATLKIPRVSKREHLPSVPTDNSFQASVTRVPNQCQVGKGIFEVTGVWKGEKK